MPEVTPESLPSLPLEAGTYNVRRKMAGHYQSGQIVVTASEGSPEGFLVNGSVGYNKLVDRLPSEIATTEQCRWEKVV